MNDVNAKTDPRVLEYQINKLQELINELHNCCKDRLHHQAKAFNLPQSELRCLMLFDGHKYLTGIEVAAQLEVAKSRATVVLDSLERKNLLQRTADPRDGRVKLISLTPEGQKKIREIEEFTFSLHYRLLNEIDPGQRANVIAALETLRSSMESIKAQLSTG